MRTINQAGIDLLKEFEGFRSNAYQDIVGVWTIGYGFTKDVKAGDTMTKAQGEKRLKVELKSYTEDVLNACSLEPTDNQLAAMVVFAFNCGVEGFKKSTLLKAHNKGSFDAASRAFLLWNKAGGKVVPGLTRRRAAEAALYLKPDAPEVATEPVKAGDVVTNMPQQVDPEKSMAKSPIIGASSITAATTTVALVSEGVKQLNEVKTEASTLLGSYFPMVALMIVLAGCGFVIYQRFKQRAEGWV